MTCSIDTFRACLSAQLTFKLISNATPAGRTPLAPRPIRIRSSHARRPTRAAPRPKFAPMHDVAEADHGERLTKGARIPSALSTSLLTSPAIPCLTRKGAALPSGNKAPTAPPLTAREPIRIACPCVWSFCHARACPEMHPLAGPRPFSKKKKCGGAVGRAPNRGGVPDARTKALFCRLESSGTPHLGLPRSPAISPIAPACPTPRAGASRRTIAQGEALLVPATP